MKTKEKKSIGKVGFLISIIGSAVGLGGIWGFPKQMYQYKGTFLIPLIFSSWTSANPVLFLEMTISN